MAGGRWKKKSDVVSSSSDEEDRVALGVGAGEDSGNEARAESSQGAGVTGRFPIRSLFPRRWEEADPLGRLASLYEDKSEIAGPDGVAVDGKWLVDAKKGRYHWLAEDLYGIQHALGYWCELPKRKNARVTRTPPEYVPVYIHHFDYGLRFPLDPFIARVLEEYNVSLC
jgi:hypothetical protein